MDHCVSDDMPVNPSIFSLDPLSEYEIVHDSSLTELALLVGLTRFLASVISYATPLRYSVRPPPADG
jgi:hypothetical protein